MIVSTRDYTSTYQINLKHNHGFHYELLKKEKLSGKMENCFSHKRMNDFYRSW